MQYTFRLNRFLLMFLCWIAACNYPENPVSVQPLIPVIDSLPFQAIAENFEEEAIEVDSTTIKKIEKYFIRKHKYNSFNGAVLFAEKGNIVYKNAFGFGDIRKKKNPLTTQTPFQIASVTKPITSTAILMLYEQGVLHLKDTIQKFIPDFPYKKITIENLLTQKSGLPEYLYFSDNYWPDRKTTMTNDDVLCMMQTHKPDRYYIPNYRYNYVNSNFAVLASIIEITSGLSYQDFMTTYIFEPSGMHHSFVHKKDETELADTLPHGHDDRRRRIPDSYFNGVVGDKGIFTSVEDLFLFDQSLYNQNLLCDTTQQLAYKAMHKRMWKTDNYGLGWRINERPNGNKVIYHSGWWKGYRSYFIRMPYAEKTVIVLTNSTRGGFLSNTVLRKLIDS